MTTVRRNQIDIKDCLKVKKTSKENKREIHRKSEREVENLERYVLVPGKEIQRE